MLENNGYYPDDPQADSIYQYINDYGKTTWAVYWPGMFDNIVSSPYCHNVILLWNKHEGLTQAGKDMLVGK
jgi:hypothetical protein